MNKIQQEFEEMEVFPGKTKSNKAKFIECISPQVKGV